MVDRMLSEKKFWYRWMLNYSVGELLGIGAAATIGRVLFIEFSGESAAVSTFVTFVVLLIAGSVEGFVIGFVQWRALSKMITHFKAYPWIVVTMISTAIGWILILPPAIMLISFLTKLSIINHYYSVFYAAIVGIAFGGLIGITQFFIIRKFYDRAFAWIFASATGWMFSFLIVYTAIAMFSGSEALFYNLSLIVMSCMLSGLVQGIVSGTCLHFFMTVKKIHERVPVDSHFPL
jgi:hypothetical protein